MVRVPSFLFPKKFSEEKRKRVKDANDETQKLLERLKELKDEENVMHARYINIRDQMNGLINNITEYRSFLYQVDSSVENTLQVSYTLFLL